MVRQRDGDTGRRCPSWLNKMTASRLAVALLVLATPFGWLFSQAPLSAGPQSWSRLSAPTTTGHVLEPYIDYVGPMAVSRDGDTVYAAASINGEAVMLKSTTFGRNWVRLEDFPHISDMDDPARFTIFDVVCSGADDNTVFVTDGHDIYKTADGGEHWTTLPDLFNKLDLSDSACIVSIDAGYVAGQAYIFAATSSFGGGLGGAYILREWSFFEPWTDLEIATERDEPYAGGVDVLAIRVLPDFSTSQGVVAVASDVAAGQTYVTTRYDGQQWAESAADVALQYSDDGELAAVNSTLLGAAIWIPSDFSTEPESGQMQLMVGINPRDDVAQGDVFWCYFDVPGQDATPALDLDISGADSGTAVTDMDGMGASVEGNIIALGYTAEDSAIPRAWASRDGGGNWAESQKRPTGAATPLAGASGGLPEFPGVALSCLCLHPSFLLNGTALAGTQGDDCGVSLTADGGATWNTVSLIAAAINDIETLDIQADGAVLMSVSYDAPWGGDFYAIWRYDGQWQRVFSESLVDGDVRWEFMDASPDGDSLYLGDTVNGYIWFSEDGGQFWVRQKKPAPAGTIRAWLITDTALLVAGAAEDELYSTASNGFIWQTLEVANIGKITSLAMADNGDLLAGGVETLGGQAKIARSNDAGVTWRTLASPVSYQAGEETETKVFEKLIVAFASDYAETGRVLATGTAEDDDTGVWAWTFETSDGWLRLDGDTYGSSNATLSTGTGMVIAPGGPGNETEGQGMIYATDSRAADGVTRIRGELTTAELIKAPASPSGLYFSGLWAATAATGNVTLYTIGSDDNIYTYTDTLNVSGDVQYDNLTENSVTLNWSNLLKASKYKIFVAANAPVTSVYTDIEPTFFGNATGYTVTGLEPDTEYFVSMWVESPVTSFQWLALSFITPPTIPTYSTHFSPIHGAYGVPVRVNFAWDPPSNVKVTGYLLEYSTAPDFAGAVKVEIAASQNYYTPASALKYDTTYYWRVATRGVGGSSVFVASIFTTESAPPPPISIILPAPVTPTLTVSVPQQTVSLPAPTVIITIPRTSTTMAAPTYVLPPSETPLYMWLILGIVGGSALITPLLIALAVRSRR